MKTFAICLLLIALSNSFKFSEFFTHQQTPNFIASVGCSDDRVKTINDSITQCEPLGVILAAQCIKNYMFNHSNSEKWDVLVEVPDKSDAKSSVWPYDDCSVRYERLGNFKLSYTIWKATASNQSFERENQNQIISRAFLISEQYNGDCDSGRVKIANDAINYCQNGDIAFEASCIRNNIRTKSGEKWNAVVSSSEKSQYISVRYDYFDSCSVQVNSFGARKRNYLVWKAE